MRVPQTTFTDDSSLSLSDLSQKMRKLQITKTASFWEVFGLEKHGIFQNPL